MNMAEYIERERLQEAFNADLQHLQSIDEHTVNLVLIEIDEAPAADVAEVKHGCGECKNYDGEFRCKCFTFDQEGMPVFMRADDFCSYGERKE